MLQRLATIVRPKLAALGILGDVGMNSGEPHPAKFITRHTTSGSQPPPIRALRRAIVSFVHPDLPRYGRTLAAGSAQPLRLLDDHPL